MVLQWPGFVSTMPHSAGLAVGVGFEPTNDLDGHCRFSRPALFVRDPAGDGVREDGCCTSEGGCDATRPLAQGSRNSRGARGFSGAAQRRSDRSVRRSQRGSNPGLVGHLTEPGRSPVDPALQAVVVAGFRTDLDITAVDTHARRTQKPLVLRLRIVVDPDQPDLRVEALLRDQPVEERPNFKPVRTLVEVQEFHGHSWKRIRTAPVAMTTAWRSRAARPALRPARPRAESTWLSAHRPRRHARRGCSPRVSVAVELASGRCDW
jgi:hypothetical protein